jgi:hypothetical protein
VHGICGRDLLDVPHNGLPCERGRLHDGSSVVCCRLQFEKLTLESVLAASVSRWRCQELKPEDVSPAQCCENDRFRTVDTATSLPTKKLLRNFVAFDHSQQKYATRKFRRPSEKPLEADEKPPGTEMFDRRRPLALRRHRPVPLVQGAVT